MSRTIGRNRLTDITDGESCECHQVMIRIAINANTRTIQRRYKPHHSFVQLYYMRLWSVLFFHDHIVFYTSQQCRMYRERTLVAPSYLRWTNWIRVVSVGWINACRWTLVKMLLREGEVRQFDVALNDEMNWSTVLTRTSMINQFTHSFVEISDKLLPFHPKNATVALTRIFDKNLFRHNEDLWVCDNAVFT